MNPLFKIIEKALCVSVSGSIMSNKISILRPMHYIGKKMRDFPTESDRCNASLNRRLPVYGLRIGFGILSYAICLCQREVQMYSTLRNKIH